MVEQYHFLGCGIASMLHCTVLSHFVWSWREHFCTEAGLSSFINPTWSICVHRRSSRKFCNEGCAYNLECFDSHIACSVMEVSWIGVRSVKQTCSSSILSWFAQRCISCLRSTSSDCLIKGRRGSVNISHELASPIKLPFTEPFDLNEKSSQMCPRRRRGYCLWDARNRWAGSLAALPVKILSKMHSCKASHTINEWKRPG